MESELTYVDDSCITRQIMGGGGGGGGGDFAMQGNRPCLFLDQPNKNSSLLAWAVSLFLFIVCM